MGHKVHPISFRIPYIKTWKSVWYSDKDSYVDHLKVDIKAREIMKAQLSGIPVGDIIISKEENTLKVVVFTAKAALVTGKAGENTEAIEKKLTNKLGMKAKLEVREVKKPDLNANIVGFMVGNQIEKRMPYKRAIKQAIKQAMEKGAKGIKIKVGGRLNGAEIARKETFKDGNIPTQTIRSDIDYASVRAETIYGTIGLKVWIYKGDVYKK